MEIADTVFHCLILLFYLEISLCIYAIGRMLACVLVFLFSKYFS